MNHYRADIDGLRALAILAVVGCHIGIPGFDGGFVGVDAFFVISGYLITTLLRREQEQTSGIDLVAFFARRVRRLAPAMALVLATVLAAGFVLLSPDGEQQGLAASAGAVTVSASNIYFGLSRLGYFVQPGQFMPLLHTWSLGVEEQFYIVWPLILMVGAGLARRTGISGAKVIALALGVASATSLVPCFAMLDMAQSVGFYGFPTRAWELGAGALLAMAPAPRRQRPLLAATLTALGVLALAAVVAAHTRQVLFTATPSLVAVASAVLIIFGGCLAANAAPSRLLAARPFVWIGKRSYPWYLWHWPLLAFSRIGALGEASLPRDIGLALVALGLAALTYRFVEEPARRQRLKAFATDRRSMAAGAALLVVCGALAAGLWFWSEHQLRRSPAAQLSLHATSEAIQLGPKCESAPSTRDLLRRCFLGASGHAPLILVMGDSHARHLMPGLAEIAKRHGVRLLPTVKSSCLFPVRPSAPWRGVAETRQDECARLRAGTLGDIPSLKSAHGLKGVVLAGKWSHSKAREDGLEAYVRALRAEGLKVAIVLDVPVYAYSAPRCYAHRGAEGCAKSREQAERERADELSLLTKLARQDTGGVRIWDSFGGLCSDTKCQIVRDGSLLYTDSNHLSNAGSLRVANSVEPMISWLTADDAP